MARSSLFLATLLALALAGAPARADDAQDRAARSFDEGQRQFAAGNYRRAAVMFEEAYAASPHPSTLFNAAKARARGGDLARAATLYAKIEAESPSPRDREDARVAREALLPKIGSVQVTGNFDQAAVDGAAVNATGPSYVEPGDHVVTGRGTRKVVHVGAGEVALVPLTTEPSTPPAPIGPAAPLPQTPPAPIGPPAPVPPASASAPADADHHGLPRVLVYVLGGATLVTGGVATWSGVDTLAQKDRFNRSGADADLDDGLSKQTRTNVLFGVTIGLAVITGVVALLSDWHPHAE